MVWRKCKGRPRKPLAEVILKCAPLRATSSVTKDSILRAICKCLKNSNRDPSSKVGIAEAWQELLGTYLLLKGSRPIRSARIPKFRKPKISAIIATSFHPIAPLAQLDRVRLRRKPEGREFESFRELMYFVYVLRSQSSGKHYTGFTSYPQQRLGQHNEGVTPSTRNRGPWDLEDRNLSSRKSPL